MLIVIVTYGLVYSLVYSILREYLIVEVIVYNHIITPYHI